MTKQSLKQMVHICILFTLILCLGLLAAPARALTPVPLEIVVNSTGDEPDETNNDVCETDTGNGVCTLRAAIMHANYKKSTGGTVIKFDIEHSNSYTPTTIDVPSALPSLGVPGITIQGPNLHDDSVLVLDGKNGSDHGLTIQADNCSIRKLTIANFGGFGILAGTDIDTVTGTLIIGNTIGDMVPLNFLDKPNGGGINLLNTTLSTIGGETSAERNVIAGNNGPGILIYGGSTNFVQGNYVGVKADGLTPLPNNTGVYISGSDDNSIGGNTVGRRNIISGNSADGISLVGVKNLVQGNYIGTDASGTVAVPNGGDGIWVWSTSPENAENQIGGPGPGQGNLISGNTLSGVYVEVSDDNIIQGNIIGLNAAQSAALPNLFGIKLKFSWSNIIGGSVAGAGNVIAGNTNQGVLVQEGCYYTSILGNFIGLNSSGQAFPNGLDGIMLENNSSDTNIGGNNDADENTIAFNAGKGIAIESANAKVMGNKIYENSGLGIDMWTNTDQQGVTPNDPNESDSVQNFPIITDISFPIPGRVLITVEVPSPLEGKDVRVNLFASDTCDPSGHGEGQVYLGHVMDIVVGGKADFAISLAQPRSFMYYTATAWTVGKGQSEFSACKSLNLYLPAILK